MLEYAGVKMGFIANCANVGMLSERLPLLCPSEPRKIRKEHSAEAEGSQNLPTLNAQPCNCRRWPPRTLSSTGAPHPYVLTFDV